MDLLKVISHHGARLATPIRSVQRVLDETESRSSPFRDMRNANQTQRRPFLLLDSQVASSDDYEEDDDDDIQDTISRLSEQLAKAGKAASTKDSVDSGSETEEPAKEQTDLKPPSDVKTPKEVAVVADGNSAAPVTVQQNADPPSSDDSHLQETASSDVHENLMDRIYAGTEERLVKSPTDAGSLQVENGKAATLGHSVVAATQVPATELVVEMPEEKVPHLYSNNVGLNDVSDTATETPSLESTESEISVPSLKINVNIHSDLTDQDVKTTEEHQVHITQKVNDKHVGVHVAVESTTLSSSVDDDPWKQPSTSERDENNASGEAPAAASPWRESPTSQVSTETGTSSSSGDDPWTHPSIASQVHNAQKAASPPPSRPTVDPNLIPGVAIEGPKHTLPLDEDIVILDDSPTLVALGNSKISKERRESLGTNGGAASDTRDTER